MSTTSTVLKCYLQLETLVTANNILHYHHVVDAYGHVSVRHPEKSDVFIMSGDKAPALVSSQADLIPYNVSDASPGEKTSPEMKYWSTLQVFPSLDISRFWLTNHYPKRRRLVRFADNSVYGS
jgi:hypothetical protein